MSVSRPRPLLLTPKAFGITNAVVTLAALSFLVWLVYFHDGTDSASTGVSLPLINAILNATSAVLISVGRWAIRRGRRTLHMRLMFFGFLASTLFLANYVYYHYSHGDTLFMGQGLIRPVYFTLLISHIALSMVTLPMILTSFYLGLSDRLAAHRRLSPWTWAGWMYVSITGVVVYLMLHVIRW